MGSTGLGRGTALKARLVIVERQAVVREGLAAWLERQRDVEVVGMAATVHDAVAIVARQGPDVVVMEAQSSGAGRFAVLREITAGRPQARLVILGTFRSRGEIEAAFDAGASACVSKEGCGDDLLSGIHAVQRGELYICSTVRERLLHRPAPTSATGNGASAPCLTAREREVLGLISYGKTDRAIGTMLSLSVKTIHTHRTKMMAKLGVHNVANLLRRAMQLGLIDL